MEGYIKLHRGLIDSEIFASKIGLKIWIWLLLKASYSQRYVSINIGKGESTVKLERGELLFGRFKAEEVLNIDGSTIYKWLKKMELLDMIKLKSNNHYTIIEISNYNTYNNFENEESNNHSTAIKQPSNSQVTTIQQPRNTYNKDNKVKESKESNTDVDEKISEVVESGEEAKPLKEDLRNPTPLSADPPPLKTWKDDFEIYLSECKDNFRKLYEDEDYIKDREYFHGNLDIKKTMTKAFKDYWSTEEAWLKKKKQKTKNIDWKKTISNCLNQSMNKVYKPRQTETQTVNYKKLN